MRSLGLLLLLAGSAVAGERDVATAVARVDALLSAAWKQTGVTPAERCDDATFYRRVSLDLVGRIPNPAAVQAFLAEASPAKRATAIAAMLDDPRHAAHMARVWTRHWLPQTAVQFDELKPEFEGWLSEKFRNKARYDDIVRSLIIAPGGTGVGRTGQVFLQANEYKPANLAGSVSRQFLGVNLDCAQCHDHPFARWSRVQFWEFAATFADPSLNPERRFQIALPNSKHIISPRLVDGTELKLDNDPDPLAGRRALAHWLTDPNNPYFARNAVNRVWADVFGSGLSEPLDDLSGAVRPRHPELLEFLAADFTASGYDLRHLYQVILRSRAWQSSSHGVPSLPEHFALFRPRSLGGDQLLDSLILAAGLDERRIDRGEFLKRFGHPERPAEAGQTILQALARMNGPVVADATQPTGSGTLSAVVQSPFLDAAGKVDALFYSAYSRPPTAAERERFVRRVSESDDPSRTLASLYWALLNSHEFSIIH